MENICNRSYRRNYNGVSDELRHLTSRALLTWLGFTAAAAIFIGVLRAADVFSEQTAWSALGIMLSIASLILLIVLYRGQTKSLAKKQKISAMAFKARKAIDNLQHEFPATFASDCQISMHYLAENGVDVNSALKHLGQNTDAYNQLVIAFLSESDDLEDELFDLMQPETLYKYGYMARELRIRAKELGLVKLSDTALFHEAWAYLGEYTVVHENWEKLSFELDEAYGIFFEYIKSLGLESNTKTDNRMTCRVWGEQLQEACYALETYDTIKAKRIFSELNKYKIDTKITQTLQGIISNIDETTA